MNTRYIATLLIIATAAGCGGSSAVNTSQTVTAQAPLRIMAVGDSITHGVLRPSPSPSWRLPFTLSLEDNDCNFSMVGSQTTNALHSTFESPHEAYSSQEANHFVSGYTNWAGTNEGIQASMASHTPDLVLLHIGTNDVLQGHNNTETVTEIDQIISFALDGGADVLVANLIPTFADAYLENVDGRTAELSDLIEAYVDQLANPSVRLVDVHNGYAETMMISDGIHPNTSGSAFIADAFYNTLNSTGYCQSE